MENRSIWQLLAESGETYDPKQRSYLRDVAAVEGDETEDDLPDVRRDIRQALDRLRRGAEAFKISGSIPLNPLGGLQPPDEIDTYAKALSRAWAAIAEEGDEWIRDFREDVLDGRHLTAPQAVAFLQSPALQRFSAKELRSWGVPFVGHVSECVSQTVEYSPGGIPVPVCFREQIRLDPPGQVFEAVNDTRPQREKAKAEGRQASVETEKAVTWSLNGEPQTAYAWNGSVIADLGGLAASITFDLPWSQDEAIWFILTGKYPAVAPVRGELEYDSAGEYRRAMIKLTIIPRTQPGYVQRVYRQLQKQLIRGRNRAPGAQALAVFCFVVDETGIREQKRKWGELRKLWNETYRNYQDETHQREDWSYASDSVMVNAFDRAKKELLTPDYFRGLTKTKGDTQQ